MLDAIIHSRITNDERVLRRVVKKFSNYTTVAWKCSIGCLSSGPRAEPDSPVRSNLNTQLNGSANINIVGLLAANVWAAAKRRVEQNIYPCSLRRRASPNI